MLSTGKTAPGRAALFLCFLAGICLLLPFVYALGFCLPRGDDYDSACKAMFIFDLPGGIYEIAREWLTWSGRYTYHFLAVFLGRAAHSRLACAIVCGLVLGLFFLASRAIARQDQCGQTKSALFGLYCLLAILCCWQTLQDFYLFTDSLTICLQGAASLGYFYCLILLWGKKEHNLPAEKSFIATLCCGFLAIGVYEHAALAVLISTAAVLCASHFSRSGSRLFLRLFLWICAGVAFSFLAPGNFQRKLVRNAASGLAGIPEDWLFGLQGFAQSPWPLAAIFLGLALCACKKDRDIISIRLAAIWLIVILCGALLLSFSFAALHAQSDFTLQSHAKFISSLSFYLACALCASVYIIGRLFCASLASSLQKIFFPLAIFGLLYLFATSANFARTATNSANGQLTIYGDFMDERVHYLATLGKEAQKNAAGPKFGLAGEIFRPDSRNPKPDPDLPDGLVGSFDELAFPVWLDEDLKQDAGSWPNKWAAWWYGLAHIRTIRPDPATVFARHGLELALPPEIPELRGAWRVVAPGTNPTLFVTWLVLDFGGEIPDRLAILRPNPLSSQRLLPLALQKTWGEELLRAKKHGYGLKERLCATRLEFGTKNLQKDGRLALPIVLGNTGHWPRIVFLSLDGQNYYRLMPFVQ